MRGGGQIPLFLRRTAKFPFFLCRTVIQITAQILRHLYVTICCNSSVADRAERMSKCQSAFNTGIGAQMYSILVLICSTALSHADCQAKTAVDVIRGPTVDSPMMCAFNAQTMIARTDLVQGDRSEYMKVVCTRSKNAEEWVAEVKAREAAVE
jgi:hypothetical protein